MPPNTNQVAITAEEVERWFGRSRTRLKRERYAVIADFLDRIRWPSNHPTGQEQSVSDGDETRNDKFWDFNAADSAVATLRECLPAMLSFWERLQWAPETREGYAAIERLGKALEEAAPQIKHPF